MSKHTSPAVIGAFVVGAVVLLATGFALFGGSQLFAEKTRYVAYFDEPTDGLRTGANVLLNGVRIGYVSDIDLLIDQVNFDTTTQVTLEILPDSFIITSEGEISSEGLSSAVTYDVLIREAGLRARLEVESFVTGQLQVTLTLQPETVPVFRGIDPPYPEIPTISSNIQAILDKVQSWVTEIQENVDVAELSRRVSSVLSGIDEIVNSDDVRESLSGLNTLINDAEMQAFADNWQAALAELRVAAAEAATLFRNAEGDIDELAADVGRIQERLDATLLEAERTLATARAQLRGDSEQLYRLSEALDELERAARAIREFFDYLERHPEALLRGKSE